MAEPVTLEWAIQQGGLALTTVGAAGAWWLERRERIKERDANASALKAAQDQAVNTAIGLTKLDATLARIADTLEQVSHRLEDLSP